MRCCFLALLLVGCAAHHGAVSDGDGHDLGRSGAGRDLAGPATSGGGMPDLAMPLAPGARITTPNPILSRGRPLTSSAGATSTIDGNAVPLTTLDDGAFWIGDGFAGGAGAWVAMDLGSGATRILFHFLTLGGVDTPEQQPIDYHLDVSADGSAWRTAVTITGNDTCAREHALDFAGQRYVRMVIDRTDASGIAHLIELEAFDASNGSDDTWMVLGDSISAMALNRWLRPDVPTTVHAANARFSPLFIDEAIGGTNTTWALTRIDGWIARFPDVRNFIVAYGTNDGVCPPIADALAAYRANLGILVDKLQAAGKRVAVPHIPWDAQCGGQPAQLAPFNDAIDALRAEKQLIAGPDLYAWFATHQSQLNADQTHPNAAGQAAMTQAWAATINGLYQ